MNPRRKPAPVRLEWPLPDTIADMLPSDVLAALTAWSPKADADATIVDWARAAAAHLRPQSANTATRYARAILRHGIRLHDLGMDPTSSDAFTPAHIEATIAAVFSGLPASTRANETSALRKAGRLLGPHTPKATGAGATRASSSTPYSGTEAEALLINALHLPSARRRRELTCMVALSLGAGLNAQEICALHVGDICTGADGSTVTTSTGAIPVLTDYTSALHEVLVAVGATHRQHQRRRHRCHELLRHQPRHDRLEHLACGCHLARLPAQPGPTACSCPRATPEPPLSERAARTLPGSRRPATAAPARQRDRMSVYVSGHLAISDAVFEQSRQLVNRSGLAGWATNRFTDRLGDYKGGRKAELGFRPLLVGMALCAVTGQGMVLRDVVRTLNALTAAQKSRCDCPAQVSERMVSRRFNALAEMLDASPHSERNRAWIAAHGTKAWTDEAAEREQALQHFIDTLIGASIPARHRATGTTSLAIDATGVASWARQNKKWANKNTATDPDAAWRAHASTKVPAGTKTGKTSFASKAWYGYWLHALVRIPEMTTRKNGQVVFTDTPLFIEAVSLTSAAADMAVEGADLLARHTLASAASPGDIVMDRAYSHGYERFLEPARALGYIPHFGLRTDQLGVNGSVRGMIIVDGQPYSPAMPKRLRHIDPPTIPGATRAEIEAWQAAVAERAPYAIRLRSIDKDTGELHYSCPAARDFTGARCPVKPESLTWAPTLPTLAGPIGTPAGDICAMQRLKVQAEDLPLWQPHPYGSAAWWASMGRRARVEGAFGCLKNTSATGMVRGAVRVMGRAKTAIMVAMFAAATNLHTAQRADDAETANPGDHSPAPVKKRGPRPRTRRLAGVRAALAATSASP